MMLMLTSDVNANFVLNSCDLKATKLTTAGQLAEIHVMHIHSSEHSFTTRCAAKHQLNKIVGEMLCQIAKVV